MRYVVAIFWLIIIVLAIVFVALNSHYIQLNYYAGDKKVYLPILLFATLVVGAILGVLAMLPICLKAKRERRRMRRRLRDVEQELKNLRNIPIKDTH